MAAKKKQKISEHNKRLDEQLVAGLTKAIGEGLKDEHARTPIENMDESEPDIEADDAHLED